MSKIKLGIKMRVTPEQSEKIQKICFENGNGWASGEGLKHLDMPYLYINKYGELWYTDKDSQSFFIDELLDEMLEKIADKIIEYAENMS